jgi:3-phenylpropionate/trans-cinnamate dioxygenase ferredoxin subunit
MSDLLLSNLGEGRPVRLEKNGQSICVTRIGREVFAIDDTCTHSEASLSEGDVSGTKIECWLHGAEFDLRTGKALTLPAVESVKTYPVQITDDSITIEI